MGIPHFREPEFDPSHAVPCALPTIHINGTGAQSLADEYRAVYLATIHACDALAAATCNARDFYPQGDASWEEAQDERAEMFRKLGEVQLYAAAWMNRASDQVETDA
jgi:hypothetical protein